MSDEEYKQLETLLGKLQLEIGGDKFFILPGYVHDGYHMSVFNGLTGQQIKQATGPTIKETVNKLKQTNGQNNGGYESRPIK